MQQTNYQQSVKKLFEEYKILKSRLNQINHQLSLLKLDDGIKGVSYEKDKVQTSQSDGMDYIVKVISDIDELENERKKIKYMTDVVLNAINEFNPTEQNIIRCKYLKNKTNVEISLEFNLSERSLNRFLKFATKKIHILIFGISSSDFDGFSLYDLLEERQK